MNNNEKKAANLRKYNGWTHIKWTSSTQNVDITTGELLTKHKTTQNDYQKIRTDKTISVEQQRPHGHVQYTTLWEPKRQRKLDFPDNQ